MSISVVVGGQYGSEGKGKVCAWLAAKHNAAAMVRCGGPNSGHTVMVDGKPVVLRQLPVGALNTNCRLLIPAGACIDTRVLANEIEEHNIDRYRIGVDPNAVLIRQKHINAERQGGLMGSIGSTLSGTGEAVTDRISRRHSVRLARDSKFLKPFLTNVATEIVQRSVEGNVIVEGTQGYELSVYHGRSFPYATSRDTTAAAFCSEAGISPLDVTNVVMVIRPFPIRVGGNSGPLPGETTWDEIEQMCGKKLGPETRTSVTNRQRRVALFDQEGVQRAIEANKPNMIIMNQIDHVVGDFDPKQPTEKIQQKISAFLEPIENYNGQKIDYVGYGRQTDAFIERKRFQST